MLDRKRDDLVLKTQALRAKTKETHELLVSEKFVTHDIPAAIRETDADYIRIIELIIRWQSQFAFTSFNCNEQICKAIRGFYSTLSTNKQADETKAMMQVDNSIAGGLLCQFRPYLHDKIKYLNRVREFLAKLKVQLNGDKHHDALSFLHTLQDGNTTLVTELRYCLANLETMNSDALLKTFEYVINKIVTTNLEDLPKQAKVFFTHQKQILESFGFTQELPAPRQAVNLV